VYVVPDGMSIAQFTNHPVRQMIRAAAYAGERAMPTTAELDALKLSATDRAHLRKACDEVAKIHATGVQSDAWARGDELAAEIVGGLSDEQRDPRNFVERPSLETMSPDKLAALVGR
jgi:hypothetical protein